MFRKKKKLETPEQPLIPQSVIDEIREKIRERGDRELFSYSAEYIVTEKYKNDITESEIRVRLADQIAEELREDMIITRMHNDDAISYRTNVMIDSRSLRRS